MSSYNYLIKTIIVGDTGVGKSCLLQQVIKKHFQQDHYATTNVGFEAQMISVNNKLIKLHIWDTAGHEIMRGITRSYYRGAVAALLVYDVTSRVTFNHLDSWLNDIREQVDPNVTVMLVGNKCDANSRRRQVSAEEGEYFAKLNGLIFLETSVKTGQNVEKVFEEVANSVCNKVDNGVFDLSNRQYCGIKKGNYESVKKSRWEWLLLEG